MSTTRFQRVELQIRPTTKVIIHLPTDLSKQEAKRIKQYVDLGIA